jgi:hypothetical protein
VSDALASETLLASVAREALEALVVRVSEKLAYVALITR